MVTGRLTRSVAPCPRGLSVLIWVGPLGAGFGASKLGQVEMWSLNLKLRVLRCALRWGVSRAAGLPPLGFDADLNLMTVDAG